MSLVRLDFSGHYPDRTVEVSAEELAEIEAFDAQYGSIYDASTRDSRAKELLKTLCKREAKDDGIYVTVAYM